MNFYLEALQDEHKLLLDALSSYCGPVQRIGKTIRELMKTGRANRILFAGMGSSLYAARSVLAQLNQSGFFCVAANAYELVSQMPKMVNRQTILVLISQSGNTPEILQLLHSAKKDAAMTVAMINQEECQIRGLAGEELMLGIGKETPISNKTYYAQVVQLQLLASVITGEDYGACEEAVCRAAAWHQEYVDRQREKTRPLITFLAGTELLDLLGDGAQGGAAQQAGLVLREMTSFRVSYLSASEFSHGWFDTAGPGYTAVYFCDEVTALDRKMMEHCLIQGGKVVLLCPGECGLQHEGLYQIVLPKEKEGFLPLYAIVPWYFLAGISREQEISRQK